MSSGSSARVWPADRSPRTIAHYAIHGRIGKGAMGVVFRARNTLVGRAVAVKLLRPEHAADPETSSSSPAICLKLPDFPANPQTSSSTPRTSP